MATTAAGVHREREFLDVLKVGDFENYGTARASMQCRNHGPALICQISFGRTPFAATATASIPVNQGDHAWQQRPFIESDDSIMIDARRMRHSV